MADLKVYNSIYEDSDGNYIFFYNGKNNIYGLAHPDYVFKNTDNYSYARVAFYTFENTGDDLHITNINENLTITLFNALTDEDKAYDACSIKFHIEGFAKKCRVVKASLKCISETETRHIDGSQAEFFVTEDSYLDDNGNAKYGVGVWLNISNMKYVMTNIKSSMSVQSMPVNTEHYPSTYYAEYISNDTVSTDNVATSDTFISTRKVCSVYEPDYKSIQRITALEEKTKYSPNMFLQNTIIYNPDHAQKAANTEETVKCTSIRGPVLDRVVAIDTTNGVFRVTKNGVYALQLKNGFYLTKGDDIDLDLKVYIGSDQIRELGISFHMNTNQKNSYSSNVYMVPLTTNDQIKVTAAVSSADSIVFENNTLMSVTLLQQTS
jgi:hypothetical protein